MLDDNKQKQTVLDVEESLQGETEESNPLDLDDR